jgi:hypothetical protein
MRSILPGRSAATGNATSTAGNELVTTNPAGQAELDELELDRCIARANGHLGSQPYRRTAALLLHYFQRMKSAVVCAAPAPQEIARVKSDVLRPRSHDHGRHSGEGMASILERLQQQ